MKMDVEIKFGLNPYKVGDFIKRYYYFSEGTETEYNALFHIMSNCGSQDFHIYEKSIEIVAGYIMEKTDVEKLMIQNNESYSQLYSNLIFNLLNVCTTMNPWINEKE